jgi:hypothetical protein
VEKPLGSYVSLVGLILNNLLGKQTQALRWREWLCGALPQQRGCPLRLNKVSSHCNDAVGVQLNKFRVIHLKIAFQ